VTAKFMPILVNDYGVVDPGQREPVCNGKDVSGFPVKVPEAYGSGTWEAFTGNSRVHAFFEGVMGEPISWVPSTEYRLNPRVGSAPEDLLAGRHQDGFFNQGIPFRVCWVPFADIPASAGGLTIAPGVNKRGYLHDRNQPPKYPIPAGVIPDSAWARPDVYHRGHVVIFSEQTPHAGLPKQSDVFRLSMDIRFSRKADPQPVVGVADHRRGRQHHARHRRGARHPHRGRAPQSAAEGRRATAGGRDAGVPPARRPDDGRPRRRPSPSRPPHQGIKPNRRQKIKIVISNGPWFHPVPTPRPPTGGSRRRRPDRQLLE
jgi:hypothetical protein